VINDYDSGFLITVIERRQLAHTTSTSDEYGYGCSPEWVTWWGSSSTWFIREMADMLMTSQGTGVNERPNLRDSNVQKRTLDANRETLLRRQT